MRYPSDFKVDGREVKDFKQLDDEKALKLVVLVYNIKPQDNEDRIARSISLDEYIKLLAKRNSPYLKKSGIFKVQYKKAKLKSWGEQALVDLYNALAPKAEKYYIDRPPEVTDSMNTERIMYLTAMSAIDTELRRRDNTRSAMSVAGQVLMGALTIALSLL
jgi:hypothetical protein